MKIGILTEPSLNRFRSEVLQEILNLDHNFLLFVDCSPKPNLKSKLKYHFKRKRGGYMIIMLIKNILSKKSNSFKIHDLIQNKSFPIFETNKPYSDDFIKLARSKDLDLLINISGFGIMIKKPLLNVPKVGTLSFHHGDMKKYRGQPAGFWELFNNEKKMKITVQLLSEKLDAGIPVIEKSIPISNGETLKSLKEKLYKQSMGEMSRAIKLISLNKFEKPKNKKLGKIYTIPNFRQWVVFHIILKKRKFINLLKI